jgi:predicted Rossmann-fold nucleotide-binding protein
MHERKVEMSKRVRAFFGLPGGFGTFEEVANILISMIKDDHSYQFLSFLK